MSVRIPHRILRRSREEVRASSPRRHFRPVERQKGEPVIAKRLFVWAAAAALVVSIGVSGGALACDKQANAAGTTAEKEGCAKKAEPQVVANGVQKGDEPCAKAAAAEGGCCAKAKAGQASDKPCAKTKSAQVAKADEKKEAAVAQNGGR